MKSKMVLIALLSLIVLSACKSSSPHCDAYGNKSANTEKVNSEDISS